MHRDLRFVAGGKSKALAERLMAASSHLPCFGYHRMAAWLDVGEASVRCLWREMGLNIPPRWSRRRRSVCDNRLPGAERPNPVC